MSPSENQLGAPEKINDQRYPFSRSSSYNSTNSSEAPQPYTENHVEQVDKVTQRPRSQSIFAEVNSDGAFPDFDANENPLVMRKSYLEREIQAAHANDDLCAQETISNSGYWTRKRNAIWAELRPDFFLDHMNIKSLVVVSRTWFMVFICSILMVIHPTNRFIGNASYLMNICAVIQVPGGISMSHALYTGVVDMVFAIFGFATNVIAHSIAWRIRGYPTQKELLEKLVKVGICEENDSNCYLHEVYSGRYLETKCTVIMLIGIMFSLTICGYFQTLNRALTPSWIFSVLSSLIIGIYFIMTPDFNPWLYGQSVIIPMGLALALRFLLTIVWFPVTSNFKFFNILLDSMGSANAILSESIVSLENNRPSETFYPELVKKLESKISSSLNKFALLKLEGIFTRGELSYSRLDPGDLGEFRSLTRTMLTSMSGLQFYFSQLVEKRGLILERCEQATINNSKHTQAQSESGDDQIQLDYSTCDPKSIPTTPISKIDVTGSPPSAGLLQNHHHTPSQGSIFSQSTPISKPRITPLNRTDTFPDNFVPKHNRKKSWLQKRLTKSYAHAANFEENFYDFAEGLDWDGMNLADLDSLNNNIVLHYQDLGVSAGKLLSEVIYWAREANAFRTSTLVSSSSNSKRIENQEMRNSNLKQALKELKGVLYGGNQRNYSDWVKNYCIPGSVRSRQHYIYALRMDGLYGCMLERMATSVISLAAYCLLLDKQRPSASLIYPFMKTKSRLPRYETEYHTDDGVDAGGQVPSRMYYESVSKVQKRSPDSSYPRTVFHLAGHQVEKLWALMTDSRITFCFKRSFVTILTLIFFSCRPTIFFAYSNQVMWVPIMTALTVSHQAVDGVYGFIVKLVVTFIGSVAGMLIWYMGDGHGSGSPYGFVAASGFVMFFLIFYRHFFKLSIPMGAIVLCVTATLVAGTSWNNENLPRLDVDVGHGFSVAWRRFVTVAIGLTIAFIGTILPKPLTSKKQVRLILGRSLEELGDIQAGIATFTLIRANDPYTHIQPRTDSILGKLRGVKQAIKSAQNLISLIDYEPPLGGIWPKHRYNLLIDLIRECVFLLENMYYLIDRLENPLDMRTILQRVGWSNVELTSALYAVIVLGSRALSTGDPLPSVTPGHLAEMYSRQLRSFLQYDASTGDKSLEGILEDRYVRHDGRIALALVSTVSAFYKRIDSCLILIKGLVGEIYAIDQSMLDYDLEQSPLMWSETASIKE